MNADRLLAQLGHIADAPDAISRLRRFILDLAVRGKLVSPNSGDEPASALLTRIAKEKVRLARAGDIRTPKQIPAHADPPFSIPPNWRWSQIAEIGVLSPRNEAPDAMEASFVPMPLISADYGVANEHEIRPWGEIKKGYTHFAEGDVGLAKITPCFENGKSTVFRGLVGGIGSGTTELHIVRPLFVSPDYILLFLKSPHFIETGIPVMTGTAGQKRVPTEYFAYSPFPLPPLAEQHRIVAKVDELMALCDRLEAARAEREAARDRLAAASLARLNSPDPDPIAFAEDARFALTNLAPMTTRPDQVTGLRQTILNLALRGKLVPQSEASGAALLASLRAAQTELVRRNLFKAARLDEAPRADDLDFEIPSTWAWACLGNLIAHGPKNGISPKPSDDPKAPKAITLTATTSGSFNGRYFKRVEGSFPKESGYWLHPNDLLFQRGNTPEYVGMAAFYDGPPDEYLYPDLIMKVRLLAGVSLRYVHLCAVAPHARSYFSRTASGAQATMPKINQAGLLGLPVPLPPLDEQERIVAKVDELMALCDRLEASLNSADSTRRNLLHALLAEALAPAPVDLLEQPCRAVAHA